VDGHQVPWFLGGGWVAIGELVWLIVHEWIYQLAGTQV